MIIPLSTYHINSSSSYHVTMGGTSNSYCFTTDYGIVNYATLIIRNDNPKLSQVVAEFSDSIALLSQKP